MSTASPQRSGERYQQPLDLGIIRRLFGMTRPYASLRSWLLLLVILRSLQLPLLAWGSARIVSGPVAHADVPGLLWGATGFVLFAGFTELCFVFRMRLALRLGELVVRDLRNQLYEHLLKLPMSFFDRTRLGRLIGRFTSDIDVVRVGVQDVAFVTIVQAGNVAVSAALMAYYDWQLFVIVLVMTPLLYVLIRRFRVRLSQAYRALQESFSRVTARLAEVVNGMREIQSFVRQDLDGARFAELIRSHAQHNMTAARRSALFQPLLEFNGQLFLATLLVVGGAQALAHEISLEVLIQFMFLSNALFAAVPIIGNQYNQALTAMAGAERVFALLDTRPDWEDDPHATALASAAGRVEFSDVGFAYEPERPVLQGISFTAEPGQVTALVGATGGGKTTLAALLTKLYLPTAGSILINGRDIRSITSHSLHRQIACVTQENFLFTGSVAENIRVGRPAATDAQVVEATRALDVFDMLRSLPQGLDTLVGEKGARISLGQRQIICFARAMLADPAILVLDEATSSVDPLTEERIQCALARLLEGRTSFVVAHRLSTITRAHLVLVVDGGRILERGTHQQLLTAGGKYAELYRAFTTGVP